MSGASWIFVVGAAALGLFGLLNIITPATTIRWQRRSTDRSARRGSELGASVGSGFAGLVGATGPQPWNNPAVRRRVRWIGVGEILLAGAFLGMGLTLA